MRVGPGVSVSEAARARHARGAGRECVDSRSTCARHTRGAGRECVDSHGTCARHARGARRECVDSRGTCARPPDIRGVRYARARINYRAACCPSRRPTLLFCYSVLVRTHH